MTSQRQIEHNIAAHDRVACRYEAMHGEIFNSVEQERLHRKLAQAAGLISPARPAMTALDYGCGTGNLTRHLLELGLEVVAADVSGECLRMVKQRYGAGGRLEVMKIAGEDLAGVENGRFDMVAAYSVLHHVPDYLKAVREMARVVRPGGVVYIDHERSESFWEPARAYREYQRLARPWWFRLAGQEGLVRFLRPANYVVKFRRLLNPRYTAEGDIHVWPDDHVEWDRVLAVLQEGHCEILLKEEYLLYQRGYRLTVYDQFKDRCSDMCVLIARKK